MISNAAINANGSAIAATSMNPDVESSMGFPA